MFYRLVVYLTVLATALPAFAADCYTNKPISKDGPSADTFAAVIKGQISSICNGGHPGFPTSSPNDNTWNYWDVWYRIRRTESNTDLTTCSDAFNNIVDQCIKNSKVWGGQWSLNGATYTIENHVYPQNPLASALQGGLVDALVKGASNAVATYSQDANSSDKANKAADTIAAALLLATAASASSSVVASLQAASTAAAAAVSSPGPAAAAKLSSAWSSVEQPLDSQQTRNPTTLHTTTKQQTTTTTTQKSSSTSSSSLTFPIRITNCGQVAQPSLPPGAITKDSTTATTTTTADQSTTTASGPSPQQICHEQCSGANRDKNRDWCIANCGCYFGAAGC